MDPVRSAATQSRRHLYLALLVAALSMTLGFWWKGQDVVARGLDPWRLQSSARLSYTDIASIYYERDVASHPVPYLEMRMEYPPLLGGVIYLTSFAPGPLGFYVANAVLLGLAGLGTVFLLHVLGAGSRLWVFAATPPLLLYAGLNWDLLSIFFALAGLALFTHRRDGWSAALLSLATWLKLFPGLLWPVLAFYRWREGEGRSAVGMTLVFWAIFVVVNIPLVLLSPWGWVDLYVFNGGRGADDGSLWGLVSGFPLLLIDLLSVALVLASMAWLARQGAGKRRSVVDVGLGVLLLLFLVNKVSSPQYDLWLVALFALATPPLWLLALFLAVDLAYFVGCFEALSSMWGARGGLTAYFVTLKPAIDVTRLAVLALLFVWLALRVARAQPGLLKWRRRGPLVGFGSEPE